MKKFAPLGTIAALLSTATPILAQNIGVPKPENVAIVDLGLLVSRAAQIALIIAAILVFVFLIWGGIQWITSGGDKGKTEEARNRITAALVGLAIVAAAWAVIQLVSTFFGINIFGSTQNLPKGY